MFEAARFPIVLVHGFNASPQKNGFGPEVVSALCADGHSVFAPQTPGACGAGLDAHLAMLFQTLDDKVGAGQDGSPRSSGVDARGERFHLGTSTFTFTFTF